MLPTRVRDKYHMLLQEVFRVLNVSYGTLLEMRVDTSNGPVTLGKNLPPQAIDALLSSSKFGNVRGLVVGRDIYYWDAAYAIHQHIADALGVPYSEDQRMVIYREDGKIHILMPEVRPNPSHVGFGFQRLLKNPDITFEDPKAGVLTGPEYGALLAA